MKYLTNYFYHTRRERNGTTVLLLICLVLLLTRWECKFELRTAAEPEAKPEFITAPKVNVNEATAAELKQLPGIGSVRSERIIHLRYELGQFDSLPQLLQVLPDSILQGITPHIQL